MTGITDSSAPGKPPGRTGRPGIVGEFYAMVESLAPVAMVEGSQAVILPAALLMLCQRLDRIAERTAGNE